MMRAKALWVGLLLIGVVAVTMSAAGASWASSDADEERGQLVEGFSTPELIDRAYRAGEISADQRLLYFAYAIHDYESLPAHFRGAVPYYATAMVAEFTAFRQAQLSGRARSMVGPLQAEFERVLSVENATVCDREDEANEVDIDQFHINHSAIGGSLTLDDYKELLTKTYNQQVGEYGWAKPPFCQQGKGACTATNPWNRYPVLITDNWDPTALAYVTGGGLYSGLVGDNPNTPQTEQNAGASCMVLRSSYASLARTTTESDMLGAVVAHEYNHAIQVGYDTRVFTGSGPDRMWYESSAAYIEDEFFDDENEANRFLWPVFDSCLGQYRDKEVYDPYSNWLLFRYAAERHGGTNVAGGGEDVMQTFWQNVGVGQPALEAYDAALSAEGSNLPDTFHNYAIVSRFMLTCPDASPYCFEEAEGYKDDAGKLPVHGTIGSIGDRYSGSIQNHYAINWVKLPKKGTYPIFLANKADRGQLRVSIVARVDDKLTVTPFPQVVGGKQQAGLAEYTPPSGADEVFAIITNQEQLEGEPNSCAAAGYELSTQRVAFVIDDTGSMREEINDVKTTVTKKVDDFVARSLPFEYHLITFKDDVNYRGKTTDPATIKSWVNSLSADGGGDCPEEMLGALDRLAEEAPHSEAWVMTDASYHGNILDRLVTTFNLVRADVTVHSIVYGRCSSRSTANNLTDGPLPMEPAYDDEGRAEIATETGGHYFLIRSAETQAATEILLNEMVTPADVALFRDEVAGSAKPYEIQVDGTTGDLNFLLNVLEGAVEVELRDPTGAVVDETTPGVTVTRLSNVDYFQIPAPANGKWSATVQGNGQYELSSSAVTSIDFQYLGDTTLTISVPYTVSASLLGPVNTAIFQLVYPTGELFTELSLFDDGAHGDGEPGDGVYAGTHTPSQSGTYHMRVKGATTDGSTFERTAPETIRVHALRVEAPAGQTGAPGQTVTYQFTVTNNGPTADTVDVTASSTLGWIVTPPPASVSLGAYESKAINVGLRVPGNAATGSVDELVVAVASRSNPLANDAVAVLTRAVRTPLIYLPTILQIPYVPPTTPLLNGNFEQGPNVGWTEYSGHGWPIVIHQDDFPADFTPHSGTWGAWLGGEFNEVSFIEQEATVPPAEPYLSYYYWIASQDTCDHDFASVRVNGAVVAQYALCQSNNSSGWNRHAVNLSAYAGQTVRVQLRTETNGSLNSNLFIDDVAFSAAGLAQSEPATGRPVPALAGATRAAAEREGER